MSPMHTSMRSRILGVWLLLCVAPTAVATVNERTCIRNTGQSCLSSSFCEEQSGPAYCKAFRCFCLDQACAGVDKKCHTGANKSMEDVASGQTYKIRNLKFNNLNLKASSVRAGVKDMSSEDTAEADKFQWMLRKPPAMDTKRPAYLIYSKHWPDAVMWIDGCGWEGDAIASHLILDELQDVNNRTEGEPEAATIPSCHPGAKVSYVQGQRYGMLPDERIDTMLNYLVKPPKAHQEANPGKQLVMIQNYRQSFMYIPNAFLLHSTFTSRHDQGAAGYWYFEPPLPVDLYDQLPLYSEVIFMNTAPARSAHTLLVFSVACVLLAIA